MGGDGVETIMVGVVCYSVCRRRFVGTRMLLGCCSIMLPLSVIAVPRVCVRVCVERGAFVFMDGT